MPHPVPTAILEAADSARLSRAGPADYPESMAEHSNPPIQLDDLIDDLDAVVGLFERNAPYTPLGGWFRPDREGAEATSPMWFQKDWVHADFAVKGSDLFFRNERVIEAVRVFSGAEVVVPHTV